MKKYRLIAAAGLFLLGACSRGTGSVELRNETDSVAYVIGLNVGYNLQRMDSTLNVEAVCQAVRDVYARTARMTPDQARAVYLRYVNVSQPEQIRAYEEQFLEDFRKSNRSYAKTDTGLTYEVLEVGMNPRRPEATGIRWRSVLQPRRSMERLSSLYTNAEILRVWPWAT